MCTMISRQVSVEGSGKARQGWFAVRQANVSYDHPFHAPREHTLNIDFVDEKEGLGERVAVELSEDSARSLIATIQAVLDQAEARGQLESQMGK